MIGAFIFFESKSSKLNDLNHSWLLISSPSPRCPNLSDGFFSSNYLYTLFSTWIIMLLTSFDIYGYVGNLTSLLRIISKS